ncbi:MAG: hypothetical protein ACON38_19790 [Akkermansiaceae bacterium]
MKPSQSLAFSLTMLVSPALADLFPNGDFTNGGTSWLEVFGAGTYDFTYPTADGNPGGFGQIDHAPGSEGFGLWVGNDGEPLTLAFLGLEAGKVYDFSMDMKLLSGSNIGGFKLDYTLAGEDAGSTGDLRTELIGDGNSWETYTFRIAIPEGVDGFKVVPLWGFDSSVGYDNIGFDPVEIVQGPIFNHDFSGGSFGWKEVGSVETSWDYLPEGGNPGGYGVMNNSGIGFGIWVANNDTIIPLEDLGLDAGTTANFIQDMILLSGENVGGVKIDFFNGDVAAGSTGDIFGTVIGDGSTWETYTFPVELPEGIDGIKIVPVWGAGSTVGYDNFRAAPAPVLPPPTEANEEPQFVEGTLVTWSPTNPDKFHQPQASADGTMWVDLGPAFPGTDTTTILDPDSAPFHRVLELDAPGAESLVSGDFETPSFDTPTCPENWLCLSASGQIPEISGDAFSGSSSMRIAVQNDDTGGANQAEIQHNLINAGGFVTPGETYTFSFYAKQISAGTSYVQQYRLQWTDDSNNAIPGQDVGFTNFTGGDGSWEQTSVSGLVAPANAAGVFIQIFGATGAVAGEDAKGEVLIDLVSLSLGEQGEPVVLETTEAPGAGVLVVTQPGQLYKAQTSTDLRDFTDITGVFTGNGLPASAGTAFDQPFRFYRLLPVDSEE